MEEIMRKHSKFITILLSAVLAVCLVQTVFVQAFATENSATPDEPTEDLYPVSMEVVKAPESVTDIDNSTFWSNVVLHIVYSNYELGQRDIPTVVLICLAKHYHTSTDYILGLTDNKDLPNYTHN